MHKVPRSLGWGGGAVLTLELGRGVPLDISNRTHERAVTHERKFVT